MLNFDEWALGYLEKDLDLERICQVKYTYRNKDQWTDNVISMLVCEEIMKLIKLGYPPCDAVVAFQGKMLRMAYIAKSNNIKEKFMVAYYCCDNFLNVFSEEEWNRNDSEEDNDGY